MTLPAWLDRDRQLGILVSGVLLVSLAALVGRIYDLFSMNFVVSFGPLPLSILLVGLARWYFKSDVQVFYRRVLLGLLFGIAATAAYDLIRLILQTALPVDFNAFRIHAVFGEMISGAPRTSTEAKVVGWSYHISNGLTFALCWTMVMGRAKWWQAVIYALVLQTMMVILYPHAFGVSRSSKAFLGISFTGHATYGLVLGLLTQRFNVPDAPRRRRAAAAPR
jgi:hypothetical protein